jgi:hypothetical protein
MPKYRVLERSYLPAPGDKGNRIYEEGETVDFDGSPSRNLQPLDDEGRAKQAEHFKNEEARISQMMGAQAGPGSLAFTPEMTAMLASMLATHGSAPTPVPADVNVPAKGAK